MPIAVAFEKKTELYKNGIYRDKNYLRSADATLLF